MRSLLLALACLVSCTAAAGSISLKIGEPADPAAWASPDSPGALRPSAPGSWLVAGRVALPDFSIATPAQLRLEEAGGRPIPLVVESGTLYREFGEIVGLRIAFEFDPASLAKGLPRLVWGPECNASNRLEATLLFTPEAAGRVRPFTLQAEAASAADEAAQFVTIEIIADSKADRYYLWYLLPMGLIFTLLIVRKKWNP
jgi:hypothetical protein